jgi:hypothetical protein
VAVKTYTVVCNGASQELTTVLGITRGGAGDPGFSALYFSGGAGNAAPIYIGETGKTVGASEFGARTDQALPGLAVNLWAPPLGAPLRLSDFAVMGANGEKLGILGVLR